mgnify:CR=1 FL=1
MKDFEINIKIKNHETPRFNVEMISEGLKIEIDASDLDRNKFDEFISDSMIYNNQLLSKLIFGLAGCKN